MRQLNLVLSFTKLKLTFVVSIFFWNFFKQKENLAQIFFTHKICLSPDTDLFWISSDVWKKPTNLNISSLPSHPFDSIKWNCLLYFWFLFAFPPIFINIKSIKIKHFFHSADGHYEVTLMTKATVYNTGLVVWQPPAVYKSSCSIDVEYFPYDVQTCVLKLGSWTYDGFKVLWKKQTQFSLSLSCIYQKKKINKKKAEEAKQ